MSKFVLNNFLILSLVFAIVDLREDKLWKLKDYITKMKAGKEPLPKKRTLDASFHLLKTHSLSFFDIWVNIKN